MDNYNINTNYTRISSFKFWISFSSLKQASWFMTLSISYFQECSIFEKDTKYLSIFLQKNFGFGKINMVLNNDSSLKTDKVHLEVSWFSLL